MENNLVKYSRAGDAFHYIWAARRCLKMVNPKSKLHHIVIEGSSESNLAGEYVIDVAEYFGTSDSDLQKIAYYQLKHTIKRKEQPFNLSDLKDTIVGFSNRYKEYLKSSNTPHRRPSISFSIVTNRPIAEGFKGSIDAIAKNGKVNSRFHTTIVKYTNLDQNELIYFCSLLRFFDGEGDYNSQRYELHGELSQLLAGTVDDPKINNVIALVQNKAIEIDGRIDRQTILQRLGVTTERDLFPASPEFEELENVILRKQQEEFLKFINDTSNPVIIHATGGVGKSIFARQIAQSLPEGSLGIVYDCFGGGRYRNRSEPRHRHRDGLVQISNELAIQELCAPLINSSSSLDDEIMRGFLNRLKTAIQLLRNKNKKSILVILIDAADNAEMAAQEYGEFCFVNHLLRESIPEGCKLVALCRTERIQLLKPSSKVSELELKQFSQDETLTHLKSKYPDATIYEGEEFHRLTNNGNPRVQANALNLELPTIYDTLNSLGPLGTTLEKQIENQIDLAISFVKDNFPTLYHDQIEAICFGLASLPPFIPIKVLAKAADVDEATVRSFVGDLGKPLWITDTSVQFRDEPTESWFRERYSAAQEQVSAYIGRLEPLASEFPYVAETLPSLFLSAGKYDELIELALSDKLLPKDNPIDERNVRIYRLQFAFKAALKLKRYLDATKLAMRAGEEVAGDKRLHELLKINVDLIAPLQHEQKVQELAFRNLLCGEWEGSENVYSAALLSSVGDYKGEARGYLRASFNWLHLNFESQKNKEKNHFEDRLKDIDILELASAMYNLKGSTEFIDFMFSWKPPELIYRILKRFFRRLIDKNYFLQIEEISKLILNKENLRVQYFMMALADELINVGRFPPTKVTRFCLDLLVSKKTRIPRPSYSYKDTSQSALISLIEACAVNKNSKSKIIRVLNYYCPKRGSRLASNNFITEERENYLRALALRCVIEKKPIPNFDELLPKEFLAKKKKTAARYSQEVHEFKERIGALLPLYIVRARVLLNEVDDLLQAINEAVEQSKKVHAQWYRDSDSTPYEISRLFIDLLILDRSGKTGLSEKVHSKYLENNNHVWIVDRLKITRSAFRLEHLSKMKRNLEITSRNFIESIKDEGPETKAGWYIDLARAVLASSREDSAIYFDYAIQAVSKFGDELVQRWEAIVAMAKQSAKINQSSPQIAYRFIRCAELVGDNVEEEKYWDRSEAISTCARLHLGSSFAAISRWRDRDVGRFYNLIPALANEIVSCDFVSPCIGWSLSAFYKGYGLEDFASVCIEKDNLGIHRQQILDIAARDLMLNEASEKALLKLKKVSEQYSINNPELDNTLSVFVKYPNREEKNNSARRNSNYQEYKESVDWETIFDGLELVSSNDINQAIQRFNAVSNMTHNREVFWKEVFNKVDENNASQFIQALIVAEGVDLYDIQASLSTIPLEWRHKVSVQKNWGKILEQVGKRFALDFTNRWRLEYFLEKVPGIEDVKLHIQQGVFEGLSSNIHLVNAGTFFGFVQLISPFLSQEEASDLLDFSMERFEIHIDSKYADGLWVDWLNPPKDSITAFAGLIWSALASPRAEIRWRAAHCIRRLAELECISVIDALIHWMERNTVDSYGGINLPFYSLHARLYLLISLARISIDRPKLLTKHAQTFSRLGLNDAPHILIQKFAAKISLNIENSFPQTYKRNIVEQLNQIGSSSLPTKVLEKYGETVDSYWHERGEVDDKLKLYHGYDFDRYWYEPLGRVFGVSAEQIQQLATEVIINEWHIELDGHWIKDPRSGQWRTTHNEQETWHDHGSYPRTDDFIFYLSYHAMFVVASKLLQKMPVVKRKDRLEDDDPWVIWLNQYMLTRDDGKWLSDRRDPAPIPRPEWTKGSYTRNWRTSITPKDFLDQILFEHKGETWLNVYGSWEEGSSDREEEVHISSALISPITSQSFLLATSTYKDPYTFKLPDYQEEDWEINSSIFELKGWIWSEYTNNRFDEYDPFANQIAFPPYIIGESIVEKMSLTADNEFREWYYSSSNTASLVSHLWSIGNSEYGGDPLRRGKRLSASLAFLRQLCFTKKCEIVFKILINRRFPYRSYSRNEDEKKYIPPFSKIYILSPDGKFRDTETSYQIR